MGFLKRAASAFGYIDKDLIARGTLVRGRVVECKRTGMMTGVQIQCMVCDLTIEVELEGQEPYTASCKHPVPLPYLAQIESGHGYVAVRVDPENPQNIAVDPKADVPGGSPMVQTIDASQGIPADIAQQLAAAGVSLDAQPEEPLANRVGELSAQEVLDSGTPCRVIVQSAQPLGFQKDGMDVWGIVLNAIADGEPTTQARIGVGVPSGGLSLLFPGSNLPAKRRTDIQDGVAIDWPAALGQSP